MTIKPIPSPLPPSPPSAPVVGPAPTFIRTPYNYHTGIASYRTGLDCSDEPMITHQNQRDECDINFIVARFGLGAKMPANVRVPMSGDFSDVVDYQTALDAVRQAQRDFMALPAKIRSRFDNDPQQLLLFASDDANRAEAESLGLLAKTTPVAFGELTPTPAPGSSPAGPPKAS